MDLHLAQFNIATLRHPIGHPATASFEALIDETNAVAEASPGFVWRHGIDSRNIDETAYPNPLVLVNASVWESPQHLRDYAYRGFHRDVFRQRSDWFVSSDSVMWWISSGSTPTLEECKARLSFIAEFGPTAFGFRTGQHFPPLVVSRHDLSDHVSRSMIERLDAELVAATPDGGSNFLSLAEEHVADGSGGFYVAWLEGQPRACGAWRSIDEVAQRPATAEVKRMWADPSIRGQRLGAAVLATLEIEARAAGITELRLETGEYLTSAVSLYRRMGFAECPAWGEYVGVPLSYTMSKPLRPWLPGGFVDGLTWQQRCS